MNEDEFRRAVESQMQQEALSQRQQNLPDPLDTNLLGTLLGTPFISPLSPFSAGTLDWRERHRSVSQYTPRPRGAYIGKVTLKTAGHP